MWWFDFRGTMQNVQEREDLVAADVQYKKKQLSVITRGAERKCRSGIIPPL